MPNWCSNSMTLRHDDPEMIQRAYKAFADGNFCQEFAPCPAELKETTSPNRVNVDEMLAKYGHPDWYSFQVSEWGTKWDFGHGDGVNEVSENEFVAYFDSAWAPPIAMMQKLEELGFSVNLMYYEPGMAFCGVYEDGNDDFYEYGGMSADEIDENLPAELNEAFDIAYNVRCYEEENEENDE